jgi:hypothetical protein
MKSLPFSAGRGSFKWGFECAVWVASAMGGLEVLDVEVGVDLGGFESGVAEHFLDDADVGAVAVHVGGAGMPKQVAGCGFGDADGLELSGDPGSHVGRGDADTPVVIPGPPGPAGDGLFAILEKYRTKP